MEVFSRKRKQFEQRHEGGSGMFWKSKGLGGRAQEPTE